MIIKLYKLTLFLLFISIFFTCNSDPASKTEDSNSEFVSEIKVNIIGYTSDAMEPFISKDENYLFFNNYEGANKKDLFYAEKIDDTTFQFKGEIQNVNTAEEDANPTMDDQNNFYFISTRDIATETKTLFCGVFNNGTVTGLYKIDGTINIPTLYWINMGVEISKDSKTMFTSNAFFDGGVSIPIEGNIRFAINDSGVYNIPANEAEILININTNDAIEYAGESSSDELELFYSQVTLSNPAVFKLYYSKRSQPDGVFEKPVSITEPFKDNVNAMVEAPSLSADGKRLYYHKFDNGIFSIFMLSRD